MTLRAYLVELVGTFLLVFFSGGAICSAHLATQSARIDSAGLLAIAFTQGAVLAVVLSFTLRVSQGCLNPAVTLTLWVTKRFDFGRCLTLIIVQLVGAVLAGMLVYLVFPQDVLEASFVGTPHLYDFYKSAVDVRPGHWLLGSAVEIVLTFLLTLVLLTPVLESRRAEWRWAPLLAGLALTAAVLVGYHLSGAALNPARWWGTAVWQKQVPTLVGQPVLQDHLPYWMGPIVGALLAGIVHAEWLRPEAEKKGERESMQALTLDDLLPVEEFAGRRRDLFDAQCRYLDRYRRVRIGPRASLLFENRQTLWFRVQDVLRIARLTNPTRVQQELDLYNRLLPRTNHLHAALLVNVDETKLAEELAPWCALRGEDVRLMMGARMCRAELVTCRPEDRCIGAAHWVQFAVDEGARALLADFRVPVLVEVYLPGYVHSSPPLGDEIRQSLLDDLALSDRAAA